VTGFGRLNLGGVDLDVIGELFDGFTAAAARRCDCGGDFGVGHTAVMESMCVALAEATVISHEVLRVIGVLRAELVGQH
jgi:hypothetical protein